MLLDWCFWVPGRAWCRAASALLSPTQILCTRVEDGSRSPGLPKPRAWSVEFASEIADSCPISFTVASRGHHMPGLGIPSHLMLTAQESAGNSPAHPGSPGPPGEPITPPCSSSSLFKVVVQDGENPLLQFLPSAAGMQEGGGS